MADVEDLTEKIRSLLESPEFCVQMGRNARARVVRDYDAARNAERFATVLVNRLTASQKNP